MPSDGATVTLGRIAEWPRRWEARVVRPVISDLCQRRRLDLVAESDLLLSALQSCQSPLASLAERRARKLVKVYADGGT
jgi:hypothetical protein